MIGLVSSKAVWCAALAYAIYTFGQVIIGKLDALNAALGAAM